MNNIALFSLEYVIELVGRLRGNVEFAATGGSIPFCRESSRQAQTLDVVERRKVVVAMLKSILAVLVAVYARENDRAAGAATCDGRERILEPCPIRGDCIDARRVRDWITVAAQRWALVIGDNE